MESRWITVDARRVMGSRQGYARRVSGEDVFWDTSDPARDRGTIPNRGRVLYLEDYRKEGTHSGQACRCLPSSQVCPPVRQARGIGWKLGLALECVATAAIVAMAVGTLLCFFTL